MMTLKVFLFAILVCASAASLFHKDNNQAHADDTKPREDKTPEDRERDIGRLPSDAMPGENLPHEDRDQPETTHDQNPTEMDEDLQKRIQDSQVIAYPVAPNAAKDLHALFAHCGQITSVEVCTESTLHKDPVARITFAESGSATLALLLNGITVWKDGMWVVSATENGDKVASASCVKADEASWRPIERTASEIVNDMISAGYCKNEKMCNDMRQRAKIFDEKHQEMKESKSTDGKHWVKKGFQYAKEFVDMFVGDTDSVGPVGAHGLPATDFDVPEKVNDAQEKTRHELKDKVDKELDGL